MNSITLKKQYRFSDILFWSCLYLFVAVVMIDPANKLFHAKEVVFVLLMFVTVILGRGKFYKEIVHSLFALLMLALVSLCSGALFFQTDIVCGLPYLKALLFALVVFPLAKLNISEILRLNYIVGLGMSVFISIMLLAFVGGLFNMTNTIMKLSDASAVYLARRENLGFEMYMFYYATMPFFFLALIYALRSKRFIPALFIMAAIFYGGSRTPILMGFAVIGYILYDTKNSKFLRVLIAASVVAAIVYIVYLLTSSTYSQEGDDFKFAVGKYLFDNSSIVGHGVGAPYWDPGRREITTTTEMTYPEMLYQYGWLLFPFVIFIFVHPFFKLYNKKNDDNVRDLAIAYLLYLVNAGTNPLLICSTGMYVFACILTVAAKLKEDQRSNSETKLQLQTR